MVNEFLIETLSDYQKLYSELQAMGAPEEALEIVRKSIDDTKLLIKEREARERESRELETRVLPASVAEAPAPEEDSVLTVGGVFKNYKELCEFMGWRVATGNTKIAQLKELNTICKWHKDGNKIVIDEVYSKSIDKVDNRVNNKGTGKKSIYYQDFEILMMILLEKAPNEYLEFTITQLMQMVGMVNEDYCKYKYSQKLLAEETEISIEEINQFYEVHQKLLSQGARICLNNLKKAYLIHLTEITMIRAFEIVPANEENKKPIRKYYDRVATKEEIKKILIEKRKLMELMGCKNMNEIYKRNLNRRFYRELRVILEEKFNISFDYTSYRVVLNKEAITKELNEIAEITKAEELIESINSKSYKKSTNEYNKKVIDRVRVGMVEGFNLESNAKRLSNNLILV